MNAKFNAKVKQTLALAEGEAREHNQDCVEAEHILLGLLDQGDGIAIKAFESRGISIDQVRYTTEQIIVKGTHSPLGQLPLTRHSERVLEASRQEAARSGSGSVGTEHLLLGLLQVRGTNAAKVLRGLGLSLEQTRSQLTELSRGRQGRPVVQTAVNEGAEVVTGGSVPASDFARRGYWYAPTVLRGVRPDMTVMREETFGPVTPVFPIQSIDEAVSLSNDSRYGLSAYVFSRDYQAVMRTVEELQFGEIYVNRTLGESIHAHHAGYRESGIGGEDGKWGLLRYPQVKTAYHHYG